MAVELAHGCEGPQPSKSPLIIVDSTGTAIAGRSAGGRPLRRLEIWMYEKTSIIPNGGTRPDNECFKHTGGAGRYNRPDE